MTEEERAELVDITTVHISLAQRLLPVPAGQGDHLVPGPHEGYIQDRYNNLMCWFSRRMFRG